MHQEAEFQLDLFMRKIFFVISGTSGGGYDELDVNTDSCAASGWPFTPTWQQSSQTAGEALLDKSLDKTHQM